MAPERAAGLVAQIEEAFDGHAGAVELQSSRNGTDFRLDVLPFAEGREITHVALLLRDISEERALRRSLEEQRVFLRAVLSELGDRVRVADADGRLHAFDGSTVDDDLHPLEWAEHFGLHHLDGRPLGPHETPLLRALRGEQVRGVEVLVDSDEGRRTMLSRAAARCSGPTGEQLGAVIVNADLTDFRDAETRLRRSEERHRRVDRERQRLRVRDRRATDAGRTSPRPGRARPASPSRRRSAVPCGSSCTRTTGASTPARSRR